MQEHSTSLGVSGTHESDAHGIDVLNLGPMRGGGAYGQGYSSAIRHVSIGDVAARAYEINHLCSQVPIQQLLPHRLGWV